MATEYYIAVNGQRCGPFSLEKLRGEQATAETLVWRYGMVNWAKPIAVPELQELLARPRAEATEARNMLLNNLKNSALRRRYLALLTREQEQTDRGKIQTYLDIFWRCIMFSCAGLIVGVSVWAVASGLVMIDGEFRPEDTKVRWVQIFKASYKLGIFRSAIAGAFLLGVCGIFPSFYEKRLGTMAAELGPLPPWVPLNMNEARARLLIGKEPSKKHSEGFKFLIGFLILAIAICLRFIVALIEWSIQ